MANEDQSVNIGVKGDIDLSGVELDPEVPLRLAAVRDGQILASQELKATRKIGYEIAVPLPFPCGFRLLLGRADVPDTVFLSAELASVPVSPRIATAKRGRSTRQAAVRQALEATTMVVDAARYRLWLGWCRRYRVHGRVVCRSWHWDGRVFRFCDDPVPGATVEIYDVDCFWWFCSRDLITTATTAPDGTFDVEFWWCCWPWRPWWERPWVLDPDLFERIRRLIEEVRPRFPFPLPDPPPDPLQLQQFVDVLGGALESGGPRSSRLAVGTSATPFVSAAETEIARLLPAADLVARRVWPWWQWSDCSPDVVFRVTQECRGETRVIHSETNAQARWNVAQDLGVTLLANDQACCIPVCEDPPCGECLKFGVVGATPVSSIGGNNPMVPVVPDLVGFAYPGTADLAFARWLSIDGVWGDMSDVDYYEVEYSRNGSPFTPLPKASLADISRQYWGPPCVGGPIQFNPQTFPVHTKQDQATSTDHFVYESRQHFEQGCTPASWGNAFFPGGGRFWTYQPDRVVEWVTATTTGRGAGANPPDGTGEMTETLTDASLIDGLYTLRVIGWKENASGKLTQPRVMKRCDTAVDEHLLLRLDNRLMPNHPAFAADHPWGPGFVHLGTRDPDCDIVSIVKNEGLGGQVTVDPCDIIELHASDTLTIHYFMTVPAPDTDRHLDAYWMYAYYAESAFFDMIAASVGGAPQADPTTQVGPTYAQALAQVGPDVRPWWGGGHYKLVLNGSAFPLTCAYLFRLRGWKRVSSGRGESLDSYHYNETEISVTIKKV